MKRTTLVASIGSIVLCAGIAALAPIGEGGGSSTGGGFSPRVGSAPGGPCPWNLDGNGNVGASALLALLVNWGPCP